MGMLQDMMGKAAGGQQQPQPPQQQGQTPGAPPSTDVLVKTAINMLYDQNFESMVQMFQQHGKEGFPQAMSIAINSVLDRLKQEQGSMDPMAAATVGVALFEAILEDLSEGGVLPDIDKQDVLLSLERTIRDWAQANPDQVDPEEMKRVIEQMAQQMQVEGQVQTPSEAAFAAQGQQPQGQPPQEM